MDIAKIAKEEKMSIESVARKYRYEFVETIREKYQAKYILTAHHQDDRIETMMFNLIRWAKLGGIHALALLQFRHPRGRSDPGNWNLDCHVDFSQEQEDLLAMTGTLFRPLLHIPKSEILEYAREKNISHREDLSNTDTDYLRNHLRINILPEFAKINPEYRKSLENFIEYSEELKDWIDGEISSFLSDKESFSVRDFEKKSPFFQKEIVRYLYEKANGGTIWLSEGNIEEMLRYIIMANGGTSKEIGKLRFMKKWNTIFW